MNKTLLFGLSITAVLFSSYAIRKINPAKEPAPITLKVRQVAGNLQAPTAIVFPGNGDIWVTEQTGKIRLIRNGKLSPSAVLDLQSKLPKINNSYEERGLLGIALHPKFSVNKKFYVFYSTPSSGKFNHTDVVAEYKLASADKADPNSGRIILAADKPDGNHNGGCLQFGKDGFLYISFGDGGGQGDKHGEIGNGQNLNTWLGKILRVDINADSAYAVPKDNPFVGRANTKPEIWAYGFRNPYRFSFDKASGQLFAGDVGQDLWEEIDIVKKGGNYGWRITEGTHCYNPAKDCDVNGITMPIAEYNHREGVSVTAGYVYNGRQIPALKGKYLFADWTGPVFYLQKAGAVWQRGKVTLQNIAEGSKITGFGEDQAGEIYVLTNPDTGPGNTMGKVYKLSGGK
ncbi:PQQ-dependent sugar dehydrogenase [Pedobacter psychroterrae]|uniref:Glucose dehydrogenase n=1 Tax=Pedobacter psychroterrae TaxID=2530453 RepID=A0A4R0NUT8_9SPHI|nr:PQQ-dependent sugar dehydrogenase [Pedobacter psychroterrae]TCD03948.1 glucose dehydrogenase [Pedobacter psychroterrae]